MTPQKAPRVRKRRTRFKGARICRLKWFYFCHESSLLYGIYVINLSVLSDKRLIRVGCELPRAGRSEKQMLKLVVANWDKSFAAIRQYKQRRRRPFSTRFEIEDALFGHRWHTQLCMTFSEENLNCVKLTYSYLTVLELCNQTIS